MRNFLNSPLRGEFYFIKPANPFIGNLKCAIWDSWGIFFSLLEASPLVRKNPIPISLQTGIGPFPFPFWLGCLSFCQSHCGVRTWKFHDIIKIDTKLYFVKFWKCVSKIYSLLSHMIFVKAQFLAIFSLLWFVLVFFFLVTLPTVNKIEKFQ